MQTFSPPLDVPNPRALGPRYLAEQPSLRRYAEFGVLYGSTAVAAARAMAPGGALHLFDFQDRLDYVRDWVKWAGLEGVHTFYYHGSTRKLKDSYCWNLLKMLGQSSVSRFDYVFLDGAHTFDVEGLAFFLIDRLLAPGGYLEFDDYAWNLAGSPTMGPKAFPAIADWFTQEQLVVPHVKLIVDTLVRNRGYTEVVANRLFQKHK